MFLSNLVDNDIIEFFKFYEEFELILQRISFKFSWFKKDILSKMDIDEILMYFSEIREQEIEQAVLLNKK